MNELAAAAAAVVVVVDRRLQLLLLLLLLVLLFFLLLTPLSPPFHHQAVAIVLAPSDKKKQVGVFRLTEPHGLRLIQKCTLTGFHHHPTQFEIYEDYQTVRWEQAQFKVVDLR